MIRLLSVVFERRFLMKAVLSVLIILVGLFALSNAFTLERPVPQPAPAKLTFNEACRREPQPDWCREFYQDLEHGRRWLSETK
jgi:hypothetical protein